MTVEMGVADSPLTGSCGLSCVLGCRAGVWPGGCAGAV